MTGTAAFPRRTAFAFRLHRDLVGAGAQTVVWSPLSVGGLLGLLAFGARGRTRAELAAVLGAGPEDTVPPRADPGGAVFGAQGENTADTGTDPGATEPTAPTGGLSRATGLWHAPGTPLTDGFHRLATRSPHLRVRAADFAADPERARADINGEIHRATGGAVPELVPSGSVGRDTSLVVADALRARVRWADPFDPARTAPAPFTTPSGTRDVPMMRRTARLPHAAADGWRMVTLAGDGGIDLDVLLPDTPGRTPTAEVFAALHRATAPRETALTLPRVEARTAEELSPYLDAAGAGTLFTGDADLSGLSPAPLRVDAILHQAVLAVDEAGAEGAAATAAIAYMGMPPPSLPFTVDRPFTAVLRRGPDLLFLAHVADPGGAADR